jgi:hypothetical protein
MTHAMKRIVTVLILCTTSLMAVAQDYAQPSSQAATPRPSNNGMSFADRVYFGGNLGLSFGTITSVQIEPLAGYILDDKRKLSVGAGLSYWYYRDDRFVPVYESDSYGYRLFSRYRILPPVYAHVEFSQLNFELFRIDGTTYRGWVPFLLVGGGYVAGIGGRSSITVQILWDVLQDVNSPYGGQPFFSMGVGVGF